MPEDKLGELQALDAVAGEQGMLLAFRVCEESGELEPVFMEIEHADGDEENEVALISIGDGRGFSLGRYMVPRARLDEALATARESAGQGEPAVVPREW